MVITTENLNQDYEIKGIVRFHLNSNIIKGQLGRDLAMNEAIDAVINEVLTKQATDKGADAIIGLRIQSHSSAGMASTSNIYTFYGTAVKLK
ncbi:MAG: YbjQ family protein [Ignavibacterium sp.]|nr:YbjQ family protein [Ignavibacterium sp.]